MERVRITKTGHKIITIFILLCFILSGCSGAKGSGNAANSGKTYEASPQLREFFNTLGGRDVLGPVISQEFVFEQYKCQYTANVLMCLNPAITGSDRYILYPLGNALNVREAPGQASGDTSSRVINGYTIYEEFVPVFDTFSGTRFAGSPITQVHINYSQQRIEQFFENLGFYRKFSDSPGTVKLLAYGALACDKKCNFNPDVDSLIINSEKAAEDQPFLTQLGSIGGATVFGEPLTQPYTASDGALEQVYTNAVLYSPNSNGGDIQLRSLPLMLKMLATDPGPKVYSSENGVVFYPVKGNLGYHVPLVFDEFITAHGGRKLSGDPIAETLEYQTGLYRQCFENYCLDYQPAEAEDQRVSMAPLGKAYLEQAQGNVQTHENFIVSSETVNVTVTEQYKQLASANPQKIVILVVKKSDQQPLSGIESNLDLTLPDGSHFTAALPATQSDGQASVIIPSMKTIQNGSILTYTVCLKSASPQPVCASGSYLIWDTP